MALISLVIGYAVIQGQNWYGGLGWGARYLLPLTPFLALWLLPVIDRLLNKQLPRWAVVVVIGVVVESVFIQFIAVSLPLQAYTDYLSAESDALKRSQENAIVAWNEGVWNPLYSPQVVSAHLAAVDHIAVAWDATGTGPLVVPLVLIVCGLAAGVGLTAMRRPTHSWRGTAARGILVLAGVAALFYIGLRSYYNDDFYTRNYAPLWKMLDQLNAEARAWGCDNT